MRSTRPLPHIQIETLTTLATYAQADNTIHLPRWSEEPGRLRASYNMMASYCKDGINGEELFNESYHRLFLAHELAHWLQFQFHANYADKYALEFQADRIAVAFWSIRPEDRAWLKLMIDRYREIRRQLPSALPKTGDPQAYFDKHYNQWVQDSSWEYGSYQMKMMIDAWDESKRPSFAQLVRQLEDSR